MSSTKRTTVASDLNREGRVDDGITQDIIIPDHDGTSFFEAGDGDLQLWVGEECFETHKYLIKRFNGLKSLLRTHTTTTTLHVPPRPGGYNSEDFCRAFKVLYASVLEGPFDFDSDTLMSALRIATMFDYPALRTYTIKRLEQAQLSAIERIKAAREFDLPSWEEPAYLELCERDESITMDEASVLGMFAFVQVTRIREMDREHKHRNEGAHARTEGAVESDPTEPVGNTSTHTNSPESESNLGPSFIDTRLGHDYAWYEWASDPGKNLPVSSCKCRFLNASGSGVYVERSCRITPCTAMAFKKLQVQQLAHTNTIARLQSALDRLIAPPEPSSTSGATTDNAPHSTIREQVKHMIRELRQPRT